MTHGAHAIFKQKERYRQGTVRDYSDLVKVTQSYEVLRLLVCQGQERRKLLPQNSEATDYPLKTPCEARQAWRSLSLWSPVTAVSAADTVLMSVKRRGSAG